MAAQTSCCLRVDDRPMQPRNSPGSASRSDAVRILLTRVVKGRAHCRLQPHGDRRPTMPAWFRAKVQEAPLADTRPPVPPTGHG